MNYQFIGFVFACVAVVISVLYLGLGAAFLRALRKWTTDAGERPR